MPADRFHVGRNMAGQVLEYDPVEAHLACTPTWSQALDVLRVDLGSLAGILQLDPPTPDQNYLTIVHDAQARDVAYWLVKGTCRCEAIDA